MIMEQDDIGVIEGNMPVYKASTMGISEAAKRHIMKQLSSFYNDPMRAVLREYYANAIDSHKKAGTSRPVEIHLPSEIHPTFWVRDWGTGMSEEFILDVYNWYGESTKQSEKDSIGHFGFGSKSGFAIASQFSVISYHNGMKYSINFLKAADGTYRGDIISARETDEPNGVLVSIPVDQSKVRDFIATAERFFKYVDPETVLVNGKHPVSIFEDGPFTKLIVDDDIEVWANTSLKRESYYAVPPRNYAFLMGGITYDITPEQFKHSLERIGVTSLEIYSALFVVSLGSISIGGTREGVQDTKKTRTVLDKCIRLLVDSLKLIVQDKIDNLDDYAKVMSLFTESKTIIVDSSAPYTYRGKPVTDRIASLSPVYCVSRFVGSIASPHIANQYEFSSKQTIVTGVDYPLLFAEKENNSFLPYLRAVGVSSGIDFVAVSSIEDLIEKDELFKITNNSHKTVITYQQFKDTVKEYRAEQRKLSLERKAAGLSSTPVKVKTEVRLPVLDLDTASLSWLNISNLNSDDLVYVWSRHMPEPQHWDNYTMRQEITKNLSVFEGSDDSYTRLSKTLKVLTTKKKVILLAGTRTPSYLEKHLPNVPSILDEIEIRLCEFEAEMSAELVKKLETASHAFTVMLRRVVPQEAINKIEDEELREALFDAPTSDRTVISEYLEKLESMNFSNFDTWVLRRRFKYQHGGDSGTDFRNKYPLMEGNIRYTVLEGNVLDHLIKYINSTHRDLISQQETATLKTTKG